jgi:hypothetical protein
MKTKNNFTKTILLSLVIISLFLITGCSNKIDSQNEKILSKVLELEEIAVNKVEINKEVIFVSMEASKADEYDTQIINWWGTIFGISSMLKGDYLIVIIENTVNKEPYTYISTNVYTIRDFNEDRISDAEFWDETLITEKKPKTSDVLKASNLPIETLTDTKKTKIPMDAKTIIMKIFTWLIILVVIFLVIFFGRKIMKKKKKNKISHEKSTKAKIKHHTRKTKEKIKKFYEKKVKPTTKKIKEKTKEKTKSFRDRLKQEPGR